MKHSSKSIRTLYKLQQCLEREEQHTTGDEAEQKVLENEQVVDPESCVTTTPLPSSPTDVRSIITILPTSEIPETYKTESLSCQQNQQEQQHLTPLRPEEANEDELIYLFQLHDISSIWEQQDDDNDDTDEQSQQEVTHITKELPTRKRSRISSSDYNDGCNTRKRVKFDGIVEEEEDEKRAAE
jgi:hypothetical protein